MPFLAVEAAEDLHVGGTLPSQPSTTPAARRSGRPLDLNSTAERHDPCEAGDPLQLSRDQHITSEANSLMDKTPVRSISAKGRSKRADTKQIIETSIMKEEVSRVMKESALLLRVDIQDQKDKLPRWPHALNSNSVPELKVEVFVHGELADVVFLNKSRNSVQLHNNTMLIFHGTRVARQLERPWVYRAFQDPTQGDMTPAQRWSSYQVSLNEEAKQRGANKYGTLPPSAEFLQALSTSNLPDRLRHHKHLSVIDVVITTGKGKKFG
jgi:hypothetical protein